MDINNLGFEIISLPFGDLSVSGDTVAYPIQNIRGELSQSDRESRADKLMVLDPVTKQYTTYQYKMIGWVKVGETIPTTDTITPGSAAFYKKASSTGTFTVAGKVLSKENEEVALTQGLNLVANPFPVEIRIAELRGTLSASDRESRADKIMVMNPVTKAYTTYQLKTSTGWTKEGESVTTVDTISPRNGFFYKKVTQAGSLVFSRPF